MNNIKLQLQKRLVANVIIDKCKINKNIIFNESWCTQERVVRFTTPFFKGLFKSEKKSSGYWNTGDVAMYEVYIAPDSFSVSCLVCSDGVTKEIEEIVTMLSKYDSFSKEENNLFSLKKWQFSSTNNLDDLFLAFDNFLENEISVFENSVKEFCENIKQNEPLYLEGEEEQFLSTKYERNKKARAACLAYHGTACVICGMDFGKSYGIEFAGKIEVHHIVPLSEIGEEYVVDPIKDLVPVCPNCHSAIHSKKDGVYTIEEMKQKYLNK